jgi:UDP-N-acetylmuramoyl-L-alanyl-D-glutamate--2,6-diaminopimelate ligase
MSHEGRKSIPAWLKHIYLCTSRVQYPRRREGAKMTVKLSDLVSGLPGERRCFREMDVRGVTCDSRRVETGTVFVAVPGHKLDGAGFSDEAIRRGCAAIVGENPMPGAPVPVIVVPSARQALADLSARFHGDPTSKLNVVGVTGTNGKTTTAYLLRSIFEAAGEKAGLLGTIQHHLGTRAIPSENTTPGSDVLQRHFAEMVSSGCKSAAMEVSSHALDQDRVRGVRFAAGLFTNLTRDHMDYHPTAEAYRDAKGRLFESLPPRGIAVLNADDPASEHYASRTPAHVVRYGLRRRAEISASVELGTFLGTRMRMRLGTEELLIHTRLIGTHNAYNMLAAAACTWAMGYDLEPIKAGLENLSAVPGRLEAVDAGQDFAVLVDYAHTEDALRNVLECLKPLLRGRLIVVFGCGGDRDRGKRPKMGRVAAQLADQVVLTSDNPRSEDPLDIIREVDSGIETKSKRLIEPDRRMAVKLAISMARRDDAVLIAGKGHETYQVCRDQTRVFDDRLVAREVLNELSRHLEK